METRQQRYEQTKKGKQTRQTAIAAYRTRRVKWEVWLTPEISKALEASIPDGESKSEFLRKILHKHLDRVVFMIHTVGEPDEIKTKND